VTARLGRRRKHLLDDIKEKRGYCKIEDISIRSHCLKNELGKILRTYRNTDYGMNELIKE
jgi:hypothetical protein